MSEVVHTRCPRLSLLAFGVAVVASVLALPIRSEAAPDNFMCYSVHLPTRAKDDLTVTNVLETRTFTRVTPHRFCGGANISGGDPGAPSDPVHLEGWRIKNTKYVGKQQRDVWVTNQFGTWKVRVRQPNYFYAPTAVSYTGIPDPLPTPATLDHFMCYEAKIRETNPTIIPLTVINEFMTMNFKLKGAKRICVASGVNGGGIIDPTHTLLCMNAKPNHFPVKTPVYVHNEYDQGLLPLYRAPELCVVSQLTIPSSTGATPTPTVTPPPIATPTETPPPDPTPTPTE